MLDDLSQFDSNSNLPAPVNNPVPSSPTISAVDISTLFSIGIQSAISDLLPLPTEDSHTLSINNILGRIENNLLVIKDLIEEGNQKPVLIEGKGLSSEKSKGNEEVAATKTEEQKLYEIEVQTRKKELQNALFEERAAKNAEKNRQDLYAQFNDFMEKGTNLLRNPFNILGYGLEKLLKKGSSKNQSQKVRDRYKNKLKDLKQDIDAPVIDEESLEPEDTGTDEEFTGLPAEVSSTDYAQAVLSSGADSSDDIVLSDFAVSDDEESPSSVLPSIVAGADDEQQEAMEAQFEANTLLAETLEDPEDSELVQSLGGGASATSTAAGLGAGASAALTALAVAAIAAVLAPHLDKILDTISPLITTVAESVGKTVDFLTGTFYNDILKPVFQDVLLPMGQVLLHIFSSIADPFISMVEVVLPSLASSISAILESLGQFVPLLVTTLGLMAVAFGDTFVTLMEGLGSIISAASDSITEFFNDPSTFIAELGEGVGKAFLNIVDPLATRLGTEIRRILPSWLGGMSRAQKDAMNEADMNTYLSRSSVASATGSVEITASSVAVYAALPDAASSTSDGGSSISKKEVTNNVQVYNTPSMVGYKPGDSL